jgi:hypothetical protein
LPHQIEGLRGEAEKEKKKLAIDRAEEYKETMLTGGDKAPPDTHIK